MKDSNGDSKYARKRRSGNMMYGPAPTIPKSPEFKPNRPPPGYTWWGEERKGRDW